MVAYAQNPTQSKTYKLPVDRPTLPPGLVVVGDLQPVIVTVIGASDNLHAFDVQLKADPRLLHVSGNFSNVKLGDNRVPIRVDKGDPNITIYAPDTISVTVDELASATQTVSIERVHALPPGFHEQASATTVTPTSVRVDGPKSQLAGTEAVVLVDLEGVPASGISQPYSVVIRDAKTKKPPATKMTVTPAQVTVKMVIQADAITVPRPVGWTLTGQPAAGYRVSNVQIAPLEVQATGPQNTLTGLLLATDPIDITGAKTDVVKTVTIRPPAGVEVNQKTAQVHVFISLAPGVSPAPP